MIVTAFEGAWKTAGLRWSRNQFGDGRGVPPLRQRNWLRQGRWIETDDFFRASKMFEERRVCGGRLLCGALSQILGRWQLVPRCDRGRFRWRRKDGRFDGRGLIVRNDRMLPATNRPGTQRRIDRRCLRHIGERVLIGRRSLRRGLRFLHDHARLAVARQRTDSRSRSSAL